ncbi:MAG: Gfo/Idh/MocA family oxidoreductase, partial [Verrucomicrobia bacterium]|nr:Gfo/Idh/MocA family oxidoreductase [Verrucomicrobiota bacterium]
MTTMSQKQLRWGILGAANIAQKNWDGLRNSGNNRVIAVASRNRERARKFIDSCQISAPAPAAEAMDSYEALLGRSDIDAVYIPLPTGLRKEWVIKAAQAGKHVLCEKPCG